MPKTAKKPTAAKKKAVKRAPAPKKLAKKDTTPFLDDKPKTTNMKVSLASDSDREDEEMKRILDAPMARTEKIVFWCFVAGLFLAGVAVGIVAS